MLIVHNIKLSLDASDDIAIKKAMEKLSVSKEQVASATITKVSIDARKHNNIIKVVTVAVDLVNQLAEERLISSADVVYKKSLEFKLNHGNEQMNTRPIIVGFGPAGIFCALTLARYGYRPIVLERGSDMENRDKRVETFKTLGVLDTNCNIQFGEGGAGTYSDGKLTTRIGDERCSYVLKSLVEFGAPDEILKKAKPHVGTDLLKGIVTNIRKEIIRLGGEIYFDTCFEDIIEKPKNTFEIKTNKGDFITENLILAIGHSARDTIKMLSGKDLDMQSKSFSVGIRIEHTRETIDRGLYGDMAGNEHLPVGEYQLSHRCGGRGVYTFCMCPGGEVVAAASEDGMVVTNGMSYHDRDGSNSNSALVVSVDSKDFGTGVLDGMYFQQTIEKSAFAGDYKAPMQTVKGFLSGKEDMDFKSVLPTYPLGGRAVDFGGFFSNDIAKMLKIGITSFGRKLPGFDNGDSILTGPETRTSSPVKIPRDDTCQGKIKGIYPCGEGAGYAGGIMSAAVDGLKVAGAIISRYKPN